MELPTKGNRYIERAGSMKRTSWMAAGYSVEPHGTLLFKVSLHTPSTSIATAECVVERAGLEALATWFKRFDPNPAWATFSLSQHLTAIRSRDGLQFVVKYNNAEHRVWLTGELARSLVETISTALVESET